MSPENLRNEHKKDDKPYEVILGVPFKPFEKARRFFWPKKGEKPFPIPESYDYELLLRRKISLFGIEGYIDVISEDPEAPVEFLVGKGRYPLAKPLGDTEFRMIYGGPNDIEYTNKPNILRFAFSLSTPADYSKLLSSYADVQLGEEQYILFWNVSRPSVKRNMQKLESGEKITVVQKNLFNSKLIDGNLDEEVSGDEKTDCDRITFVWLPDKLKLLQTIALNFHLMDGGDDRDQPVDPISSERNRIPVPA